MTDPEKVYDHARAMRLWWDQRGKGSWASGETSDLGDYWTMQNARSDIAWAIEKEELDR